MFRATLKSVLSRKLRLILSGLAVILGVMFVSGAFVLTDTLGRSFDNLFATVFSSTDLEVQPKSDQKGEPAFIPESVLTQVRGMSGVADARGMAWSDGARVIGSNGKVVSSFGPPRLGGNWTGENDLLQLRQGRGPQADNEIAVNAALAKAAGIKIGDQVGVLTLQPRKTFTLVGIFGYSGNRDTLGGSQVVLFTLPVAQELMLGEKGVYSSIDVTAASGVTAEQLRTNVRTALGTGYEIKTAKELQEQTASDIKQGLDFFNKILLGFAAVALFVGIFLILNTFSIIVAQRTRELALMRAIGASRRQMIGSVLIEATVIGLVASVLGLAAGFGIGLLMAYVFGHIGGSNLEMPAVAMPPAAIISAFTVGILVTVVAALLPALRASRIPPVAALQEASSGDRPLTRITISGAVIGAAGSVLLAIGLTGNAGSNTLWAILGGILISFIGVALLTPLISRPVVALLGRLFSWSVPGKLGRLNSGRNPRRTAITAAALMVGLALITGVNVILTSATTSVHALVDQQVKADLVISGEGSGNGPVTFDKSVLDRAAAIPGVRSVVGGYFSGATINGDRQGLDAITETQEWAQMLSIHAAEGSLATPGPGQILVDVDRARQLNLHVGSTVTVELPRGGAHTMTITGTYAKNDLWAGWIVGPDTVRDFRIQQPALAFLRLAPGANAAAIKGQVNALLADSPEVTVADRSDYIKQQEAEAGSILTMIQVLLALAILIAVLGIINTLALSVIERTRELGLLRAIGLGRVQVMRMITVEAVVISVFGALLGLAVGSGLGAAVVRALKNEGFTHLAFPWQQMGVYLALAGLVGVVAAVLPAIRAARTNVLAAIAHE
jgi:putative ABC transport system permease protein